MDPATNGNVAWILVSAALVLFMTPGLAFFYGGMDRTRNVLNMLMMNFYCVLIVPILWVLVGELRAAKTRESGAVSSAINRATMVLLVTWCVYPITYLFPVIDAESQGLEVLRQAGYTVADITAKALYGLMILGIAKARSANES